MSLCKSITPARLDANRPNTEKSTGPRPAQGKAHSPMNGQRRPLLSCAGPGGSRTAPTYTQVNCGAVRRPAWADRESFTGANARRSQSGSRASATVRLCEKKKEFFFKTFEAVILLKTNEMLTKCTAFERTFWTKMCGFCSIRDISGGLFARKGPKRGARKRIRSLGLGVRDPWRNIPNPVSRIPGLVPRELSTATGSRGSFRRRRR